VDFDPARPPSFARSHTRSLRHRVRHRTQRAHPRGGSPGRSVTARPMAHTGWSAEQADPGGETKPGVRRGWM